ncbi:hypothetical protein O9993_13840 [Vibrio lentus]|nr:hypothetical protein [Vibrio lentus]
MRSLILCGSEFRKNASQAEGDSDRELESNLENEQTSERHGKPSRNVGRIQSTRLPMQNKLTMMLPQHQSAVDSESSSE